MNPTEIARIVKEQINQAMLELTERTFYRGIVLSVSGSKATIALEGNTNGMPNITCLDSYTPVIDDKVLVLSIGSSGANFICIGKIPT